MCVISEYHIVSRGLSHWYRNVTAVPQRKYVFGGCTYKRRSYSTYFELTKTEVYRLRYDTLYTQRRQKGYINSLNCPNYIGRDHK